MKLYSGIDLHLSISYLAIIGEDGKRVFKQKLPNDGGTIIQALLSFSSMGNPPALPGDLRSLTVPE